MSQNEPKDTKNGGEKDHSPRPPLPTLMDPWQGSPHIRSVSLTLLAFLGAIHILYLAKPVFLPIVLSILLSFLLSPIVRGLKRLRLPESVGAALVLITLLSGMFYGTYRLSAPATEWIEKGPESVRKLEYKLRSLKEPVEKMTATAKEVEKITDIGENRQGRQVEIDPATVSETIMGQTPSFFIGLVATLVLLYFLLASGDLFLRKIVRVLPHLSKKRQAVEISRSIERQISTYLLTITLINAGLGTAVGIAMALLGVPNPTLWGVLAGLLNFVPYLGAVVNLILLSLVAVITFDQTWQILLVPLTSFSLTTLEGYLVTPLILGRRLTLNPVVILVSLIFWGWLWGVAGVLLAVPILVTLKIFCDHVDSLFRIGHFLEW